ncbi:MAG: NAD-dependent epimerase/dehydratase family protein [Devosia sp.]
MRIAISGAAGGIGRRLVQVLHEAGHDVTGIVRTLPSAERANAAITYVASSDAPAFRTTLSAADCVIHCALDSKARDFLAANKAMDDAMLQGTLAGKAKLYVYFSSQVVYSGIDPADADGYREDQALVLTDKLDAYTRLKIEGERIVQAACTAQGRDWLIVRPTVVTGPGLAWSDGIVKAARLVSFGIRNRILNLVHADDLSVLLERLVADGARNEIFNLGGPNTASEDYFNEVSRITRRRTLFVPDALMRIVGNVLPSTMWFFARRVAINADKAIARTKFRSERPLAAYFTRVPTEHRAETLEALQALQRSQVPFRAHGQGYSHWFNPPHGDDRLVMAGYRGVVSIESDRVTVKSGTRLHELNEYLDEHGLMLPTLPEFSGVSAGACFFVDVHGSSAQFYSLYDLIEEVKFLDESGAVAVARRGDAGWAGLRHRESRFILLEVTFRCAPTGWLGNQMDWEPDANLPELMTTRFRRNLSTTIQWYPFYRRLLVYNINPVEGPNARSVPSRAPFRGLPYHAQRFLLGVALTFRSLMIDRAHTILAPWKRLPLERLFGWYLSRPGQSWRDMEIVVTAEDGLALIEALRAMVASGTMRFTRRNGIGIRFSHRSDENRDYVWVEFVSDDTALVARFLETARRVCTAGVTFHRGKYVPR